MKMVYFAKYERGIFQIPLLLGMSHDRGRVSILTCNYRFFQSGYISGMIGDNGLIFKN